MWVNNQEQGRWDEEAEEALGEKAQRWYSDVGRCLRGIDRNVGERKSKD